MSSINGKERKLIRVLKKRIPVIDFLINYDVNCLISDLIAGISVALTLIPQGISCALLAGLPAQYGLYGSFMGCYIYAILGTRRTTNIGPTVVQAILVAPYVAKFGIDIAILICFISGCIITLAAIFNMTFIVDFISAPMLDGFMSAVGFTVIGSQLPSFFGFKGSGSTFLDHCITVINNLSEIKLWDTVLGISGVILILLLRYFSKYSILNPKDTKSTIIFKTTLKYVALSRNALCVVISTIIIASITKPGELPPVTTLGDIEEGLPPFTIPNFIVSQGNDTLTIIEAIPALITPSIVIPIIIIVEAISTYEAFAQGSTLDVKQEMFTTGFCNLISSFFLSPPIAPSIVRSSIANAAGSRTTVNSMWAGTLVVLTLEFLTQYFQYLPNTALAAVIISSIYFTIQIHNQVKHLWNNNCRRDLIPLVSTFLFCLLIGQDYGMIVGGIINVCLILYDSANVNMSIIYNQQEQEYQIIFPDSLMYPFCDKMRNKVRKLIQNNQVNKNYNLVFNGINVNYIDSSSLKMLSLIKYEFEQQNFEIKLINWNDNYLRKITDYLKINNA